MTPIQLRQLGEALYGPRWQSDMAADLRVNVRTVRRWVAGQPIPPGATESIWALAASRREAIDAAIEGLTLPR